MATNSKFEKIKASGHLPTPKGVALRVIQLTHKDDVTNQEIAHAIKSDPALSSRLVKVANSRVAYQTRPVVSVVDAVTVLGLSTVRQLVLGLSLMEDNHKGKCQQFDYQGFWAHSLLTAITAQNLVLHSGIGSAEEVFILGLLGEIGALALATVYPLEYGRIIEAAARKDSVLADSGLADLERAEFDFDHNQLTQAMVADWGMPRVFQEVVLHHENPERANFGEGGRDWRLLNMLHVAGYFSQVCLAQETHRRKMIPRLILIATRMGVELESLAKLGDKSVHEWHEWCKLCGIPSQELPPLADLLKAAPLTTDMLDAGNALVGGLDTHRKESEEEPNRSNAELEQFSEILRLIQNLIGNAIKYRVVGRRPEITLTSQTAKNEWYLSVADNGIGIIPDQIKRLFQVFQRLHSREAYEGTGIGLALCRKIAEYHKGRIWAESAGEGKGSKFCVVLPIPQEEIKTAT